MVCRYSWVETRALPGSSQVVILIVVTSVNYYWMPRQGYNPPWVFIHENCPRRWNHPLFVSSTLIKVMLFILWHPISLYWAGTLIHKEISISLHRVRSRTLPCDNLVDIKVSTSLLQNMSTFVSISTDICRLNPQGEIHRIVTGDHSRTPVLRVPVSTVLPVYRALKLFHDKLHDPGNMFQYKLRVGESILWF